MRVETRKEVLVWIGRWFWAIAHAMLGAFVSLVLFGLGAAVIGLFSDSDPYGELVRSRPEKESPVISVLGASVDYFGWPLVLFVLVFGAVAGLLYWYYDKLEEPLRKLLERDEAVLYINRAEALVRQQLVFTNRRLFFFRVKRGGTWSGIVSSVRWGDLAEAKVKGWLTITLRLKYRNGEETTYEGVRYDEAYKVKRLLAVLLPGSVGENTPAQGMVYHCVDCLTALPPLVPLCPECGRGYPNVAAEVYAQGKYAEAEPLYKQALTDLEKGLGPEHPNVAQGLEYYADLLRQLGRDAEAEKMEARAQAIRAKRGQENPAQ